MFRPALWVGFALMSCGPASVECVDDQQVLAADGAKTLTCAGARDASRYLETLAARPMSVRDRQRIAGALKGAWDRDSSLVDEAIHLIGGRLAELPTLEGVSANERRGQWLWEAWTQQGPVGSLDSNILAIQKRSLAVWATDDAEQLALAESDIEGWLSYASLCREVQEAGPLLLSVANRVPAYHVVRDRFAAGTREQQIALLSMGPYWRSIRDHWKVASYEQQRHWIHAAPLPPPMTATSLGYLEQIMTTDPTIHVDVLHRHLGPFRFDIPP